MSTLRAADAGHTLVEDAAVEVAMDRELHTVAQVAVGGLEALLLDQQEALEVVGQSAGGRALRHGSPRHVFMKTLADGYKP